MTRKLSKKACVVAAIAWLTVEQSMAVEIEPMGKALVKILGTTKVFRKNLKVDGKDVSLFYSKDGAGKPAQVAFIEKGIYEPNCTHTWAIGVDPKGAVSEVRVIEMSCPHAFPCKAASFLDQYKGKTVAEAAKLGDDIDTVAKATGSSKLTTDAVKRALTAYPKAKGQL